MQAKTRFKAQGIARPKACRFNPVEGKKRSGELLNRLLIRRDLETVLSGVATAGHTAVHSGDRHSGSRHEAQASDSGTDGLQCGRRMRTL